MAISRSTAARLCTKAELELVEASFPPAVRQLTPGRLRQKVERSRKLRDKYRDLAKRQRLEARGKVAPRRGRAAQGSENTERKIQLFEEVLERFQKQVARNGGTPAPTSGARKNAAATRARVTGPGAKKTAPRRAGKKAATKRTAAKRAVADVSGGAAETRIGRAPAEGKAKPAPPGRPGAAALKGARQRPDAQQAAQPKSARGHNRAAGQRSQSRRDTRN